ncbi:hypothetical protein [Janibacter sp. G1551]|uniref:hypothetical protein n=1 Tax=Janibacter sp. G1551 TaxID=3420440 RepID=UPI003CFCEC99
MAPTTSRTTTLARPAAAGLAAFVLALAAAAVGGPPATAAGGVPELSTTPADTSATCSAGGRTFKAVKTAMLKTTANVGVHGASTANPSSARNLRTDQSRPHWAGARRSAADSGVPRALPVSRLA